MPKVDKEITESTKARILEAAGQLFAEKGFGETTVRDICARADANLASVNYHFRDKENLFAEVIKYGFSKAHSQYPPDFNFEHLENAHNQLRQFIWNMLMRRYDKKLPQWFPHLMSRNMQFAHSHVHPILQKFKKEVRHVLNGILKEILGEENRQKTEVAVAGIIGHILFFLRPRHPDEQSPFPEFTDDREFGIFVDRIYMYALGGIEKLKGAD